MNLQRELHGLVDQVLSDDPRLALVACRRLGRDQLPWLTKRAVISARQAGWSWAAIGKLSDVSAQAARQRFVRLDEIRPPTLSPTVPRWGDDRDRRYFEHQRHQRLTAELRHWEMTGTDIVPW